MFKKSLVLFAALISVMSALGVCGSAQATSHAAINYPASISVCVNNVSRVMIYKKTCDTSSETRQIWPAGLITPLVRTVCIQAGAVLGYSSEHRCGRGETAIDFTVRGARDRYIYACLRTSDKKLLRISDPAICTTKVFRWMLTKQEPATCANRGVACEVGDVGPGGGIVFFVDDADEYGFTFLEAAASNWYRGGDKLVWTGCSRRYGKLVRNTPTAIGTGEATTSLLYGYCTNNPDEVNQPDRAPMDVINYAYKGLDDWFIPSWDEMTALLGTDATFGVDLDLDTPGYCTTRVELMSYDGSEYNDYYVMHLDGSGGMTSTGGQCSLRPIRAE